MTVAPVGPRLAILLVSLALLLASTASPAQAFNPIKPICTAAGFVDGLIGKACSVVQHGGRVLSAGKKLVTGDVGGAAKSLLGEGASKVASTATTALALAALVAWVVGGAGYVLHETSSVLGRTTEPQLTTTWFSATYWRVAGIAAVLTLPFLFAAAIQALVQSDITLLLRAALGYLPLALLAVTIAAPLTMLLLAASDQMASVVSSAASHQSAHFLNRVSGLVGALTGGVGSAFLGFFVALITVAAALGLWIELLMRAAAVYVIVLLLPLAFAAFVWPARRIWAVRAVELLVALILSKFVIVAVLSLGGAALSQSAGRSIVGMLAGAALLVLAAFAPWALLRLLPVTEIAAAAAGSLRHEGRAALGASGRADAWAGEGDHWASKAAQMQREARTADTVDAASAEREGLGPSADPARAQDAPDAAVADRGAGAPPAPSTGAAAAGFSTPSTGAPVGSAVPQEPASGGDAEPARTNGEADTDPSPGIVEFLQSGGKLGPVTLGPEGIHPWTPAAEAGGQSEESAGPADHPDPSPPPQDPEEGRL